MTMSRLGFEVIASAAGSRARAARFTTLHGDVQTPVFMPVGTHATVKGLTVEDLESAGARMLLSPERSIAAQLAIGSDVMMAMDECVASTSDHATAAEAMHRTHRWAARSLVARGDAPQALFGILQGACFDDLRRESAEHL